MAFAGNSVAIDALQIGATIVWIANIDVVGHELANGALWTVGSPNAGVIVGSVNLASWALLDRGLAIAKTIGILVAIGRIGHIAGIRDGAARLRHTRGAWSLCGILAGTR